MSPFLDEVASKTRKSLEVLKAQTPLGTLKKMAADHGPQRPFQAAIRKEKRTTLIAELKQASPSAGMIRQESDIEGRIAQYEQGGASALSILTEESYFHGSPRLLGRARQISKLPLLRKDFILDPWQLYESRMLGADAALLIVALLGPVTKDYVRHAQDAQVESLVEIHNERELDVALEAGATMIGINNRDLQTLKVDIRTAERLAPRVPKDRTLVIESGVKNPSELPTFRSWGAHAALVGETLMRSDKPEILVREFVEAGKQ